MEDMEDMEPQDPRHVICQHIVQLQLEHLLKQGQAALPMLTSQAERFARKLTHHPKDPKMSKKMSLDVLTDPTDLA